MVINNKTVLSGDEATLMLSQSAAKEFKSRYLFIILVLACGVFTLIIGMISYSSLFTVFGASIAALAIAYFIFTLIQVKKLPKKVILNNKEICENGVSYDYNFKEHSVTLFATIPNTNSKPKRSDIKYETLNKIYEFKDLYELRFSEGKILYVYKSGFESDKYEEIFRKNIQTKKLKIKQRFKN